MVFSDTPLDESDVVKLGYMMAIHTIELRATLEKNATYVTLRCGGGNLPDLDFMGSVQIVLGTPH